MIKHFSAGGVLLNPENNKIFLLRKISRDEWGLPKGTIEENEDRLDAAVRELQEETGYKNIEVVGKEPFEETFYEMDHPKTGEKVEKTVYYFMFNLLNEDFEPTQEMEDEELEGGWLDIDEAIEKVTFDEVREVLKKAKALLSK